MAKKRISLSDHFTFRRLLAFAFPSIVMMVFTALYSVVDGFFVSNFAGKDEFTAVNLIYPFLMIMGSPGFMLGTGGTALVGKKLGEGKEEEAKRIFSLFVYLGIILGVILGIVSFFLVRNVAILLGASEETLIDNCAIYGRIILIGLPFFSLQNEFQAFMVTAEKPKLGLAVTLIAGGANIVLDAILVGVFKLGLEGAAAATLVSQILAGSVPLLYFAFPNKSRLRLTKPLLSAKIVWQGVSNGSSELLSNISMSFVSMLYNAQLMKYAGNDGVAAYGVLMYLGQIFAMIYIGYAVGTAPVFSFHYGAGNHEELKGLLRKSLVIVGCFALAMVGASYGLSRPLSLLYVGYDETLLGMTVNAFYIYSLSFAFCGFAIFGSSFFTALNNGLVSAIISFLRTLVFQVAALYLLSYLFGLDGIWWSIDLAELMACFLSLSFIFLMRKKYHYGGEGKRLGEVTPNK